MILAFVRRVYGSDGGHKYVLLGRQLASASALSGRQDRLNRQRKALILFAMLTILAAMAFLAASGYECRFQGRCG